jgi:hypothetical protein
MVPDNPSRPSMSVVHSVSAEEVAAAERWQRWQARYAAASRTGARRARIAFIVIFAGMGAWFGLQFFNPSFWP